MSLSKITLKINCSLPSKIIIVAIGFEMNARLSVSIVLYNTSVSDIRRCIASLRNYKENLLLVVIDNSPTDILRSEFGGTHAVYIHRPDNPGYGAGHNIALRLAAAQQIPYHLVINADVSFSTDIITPLLSYMDANPAVGHVMPLVLNPDGSVQRLCKLVPTPMDLLFRRFLPRRWKIKRDKIFELHQSGYDKIMFVPYLSGCFMLLRQRALESVGIFDERFFMYPEDIDLTRRMAMQFDTMFVPTVSVVHDHGRSSHKSLKMFLIHAFNIIRYFNKWGWIADRDRKYLNARTLAQLDQAPSRRSRMVGKHSDVRGCDLR